MATGLDHLSRIAKGMSAATRLAGVIAGDEELDQVAEVLDEVSKPAVLRQVAQEGLPAAGEAIGRRIADALEAPIDESRPSMFTPAARSRTPEATRVRGRLARKEEKR